MDRLQEFLYDLPRLMLSSIGCVITFAQIALAFFVSGDPSETIQWIGWICLWSAGFFGVLPILIFRRKGKVPKGESYMKTTSLVDSGLYSIVRHPQNGTAWLLINLGVLLIAWHWTSLVLGLLSMTLAYADTFKADRYCIDKFGTAYQEYMEKVPRINFIRGIYRLVKLHGSGSGE